MKELLDVSLVELAPPHQDQSHWLLRYTDFENKQCELKIPLRQGLRLLGAMQDQAAMGNYLPIFPI